MNKAVFLLALTLSLSMAFAEFKILDNTQQFDELVNNSKAPVIVQFSAYWCGPCQRLKDTFIKVAPSYTDDQVQLAYVDAYVNTDLKKYLQGGYPTTQVFSGGKATGKSFVGSQSETYVRSFVDGVIKSPAVALTTGGTLLELQNTQEFEALVANSKVPVIVQFSAYWCNPCQKLKKTLVAVAPSYSSDKVQLAYVDAYVNADLKKYLQGGYPTVVAFNGGKATDQSFVGSQSETYVRSFIDAVVENSSDFAVSAERGLKEVATTEEFNQLIANATAPVMVQFSAHWCGPCQKLKATLQQIAPSYSDNKILLVYVDAYVNTELKKYLQGGYPTIVVFNGGKATDKSFVGNKSETFVRSFIDSVIQGK